MSKVTVEKVNGEEVAKATVTFDLGKVHRDTPPTEDGDFTSHSVIAGMNIDGMEHYFKKLIFERASDECTFEDYEELLEQYVGIKINQIIGVKSSPLTIDLEGKLNGLDESIEVKFKGDIKDDIELAMKHGKHASHRTTAKRFLEGERE